MHDAPAAPSWTPIALLRHRFAANVQSLAKRHPEIAQRILALEPGQNYFIQPQPDRVLLGMGSGGSIQAAPQTLAPPAALEIAARLCPDNNCQQSLLIAGEDLGWLWNYVYQTPCALPSAPGHRPPLYLLIGDLERLWVILHIQDWCAMLADPRVQLFVGRDAFDQFRASLVDHLMCPWPKVSVRVDSSLWPASVSMDDVLNEARLALARRLVGLNRQMELAYANATPQALAARLAGGEPLKVLGITSRYTTFLQHSMRNWLASFERLGHRSHLLIETADHEVPNTLATASVCAEFKPDLIVIIDHFRKEVAGLPQGVPVVMWVQDALPNIFNRAAGAAQGDYDYALGFARLRMVHEFGYPANRYMTAIVGLDEDRFKPQSLSAAQRAQFGCDVSFVSHASIPADVLLATEIQRLASPESGRLLASIYDQLRAVYDAGEIVTEPVAIRRMIDRALADTRTGIAPDQMPALMELFTQKINNALFRHQSLIWLAEMGVDLRLYGRGWEKHPTLGRFARGIADHASQLSMIYQASKIGLQTSPHGAVHQRMLEGLAAGGFFLIRRCPGDLLEREFRAIWQWCRAEGIAGDSQLLARATPEVRDRLRAVAQIIQLDPFAAEYPFVETLRSSEESGYIRSAGTVWGDDYDAASYGSARELRAKVSHFLTHEEERVRLADSMRRPVLERFTYVATSRRLIEWIAADMAAKAGLKAAA